MNNKTKEEESENLHKADQVYFLYDPQPVRLLDVIYVGPVMIYAGIKAKDLNAFVRWSLIGVGICTVLYNGANFFINEKKAMERRKKDKMLKNLHEAELQNFVPEPLTEEQILKAQEIQRQHTPVPEYQSALQDEVLDENPQQLPLDRIDTTQNINLPKEVLDLINESKHENEQIIKKQRGRPSKEKTNTQKLIQSNGHSIQTD
jgi:hypothetical protein